MGKKIFEKKETRNFCTPVSKVSSFVGRPVSSIAEQRSLIVYLSLFWFYNYWNSFFLNHVYVWWRHVLNYIGCFSIQFLWFFIQLITYLIRFYEVIICYIYIYKNRSHHDIRARKTNAETLGISTYCIKYLFCDLKKYIFTRMMAVPRSHITLLSNAVQTPNQTKKFGGKSEKRWQGGRHLRLNSWMVKNTGSEFVH